MHAVQILEEKYNRGVGQGDMRVSEAIFRGWLGSWHLVRQIHNRHRDGCAAHMSGQAHFVSSQKPWECHYREAGMLQLGQTDPITVYRHYTYAYDHEAEQINAYFAEAKQRGHLFHSLAILQPDETFLEVPTQISKPTWRAQGEHDCGDDKYQVSYCFAFLGLQVATMEIIYKVCGPHKDYTSRSLYTRR